MMATISEHRSTGLRDPERRRISKTNEVAFGIEQPAADKPQFAYDFKYDPADEYWIVSDLETGIFGHGDEIVAALLDFHVAARQYLDILEQEDALSEELSRQLEYLRVRVQH